MRKFKLLDLFSGIGGFSLGLERSGYFETVGDPVLYPAKGDYYHCERVDGDHFLSLTAENGERIQTQLTGAYNFENVAVALAVGKFFGVDAVKANAAVRSYQPGNMRSQVLRKGTNTIILDAYNANPTSMEAAIDNLHRLPGAKKVAILGDMFELEGEAEREHAHIGEVLREREITAAYLCGALMAAAKKAFPQGKYFATKEELLRELTANPITDATVLVKASRGMALEKVVDAL